ncbi:kinase-like protein [Violaceomyces palustris]|uniref:Kinase-like protein n=1 Tax=Violaceomyces palustris TaxID=1673888 RepID=A0ACD0NYD6_9BASI|nr:kinase-like protein [Violaceomyces palustris]
MTGGKQNSSSDDAVKVILTLSSTSWGVERLSSSSSQGIPATPSPSARIESKLNRLLVSVSKDSGRLTLHSRGLCSRVYRHPISSILGEEEPSSSDDLSSTQRLLDRILIDEEAMPGSVCVKRVVTEDQFRPHDVELEVEILSRISCPNVVKLLGVVEDTTDPFSTQLDLVMPFHPFTFQSILDEPCFSPRITNPTPSSQPTERNQSRPPPNLLQLVSGSNFADYLLFLTRSLFSALDHLHSRGIQHRDLKPSNILITERTGLPKLIDFGTSLDSGSANDRRGDAKVCEVGTGPYRAPELLFAPRSGYQAEKVDLWSVAVSLIESFRELKQVATKVVATADASCMVVEEESSGEEEEEGWGERSIFRFRTQEEDPDPEPTPSGHQRIPLFSSIQDPNPRSPRSDISLASNMFNILPLPKPEDQHLWPESEEFQPNLERLPFPREQGRGLGFVLERFLRQHGTDLQAEQRSSLEKIFRVLASCVRLSASSRPAATEVLKALEEV